jgi:hypothetical protein
LQYNWLLLTPQLQAAIIFICEPLTFLISIWGMTLPRDFVTLRLRGRNLQGKRTKFSLASFFVCLMFEQATQKLS